MDNGYMQTLRLAANQKDLGERETRNALEQAARILRDGGTVAVPTETVYGLGANALNPEAVAAIFAAKQRPNWDPLIVHVCDEAMLNVVAAHVPETARKLIGAFWPGPLTLLLPRTALIPDAITAGRRLVGVRMPAHPVALELIRLAGVPIAAPSANRFGHTSPTTAQHVLDDLEGRIDAVVDAGPTEFGLESTVLDPGLSPMMVYRPGAITLKEIRSVAGPVEMFEESSTLLSASPESLPSPGVGIRHYAPRARLILVEVPNGLKKPNFVEKLYHEGLVHSAERVGVMLPTGLPGEHSVAESQDHFSEFTQIFWWGQWSDHEQLAQRLFAGLRELDAAGCTVILCPVPPAEGIGVAIRDRLRKAADQAAPLES